MLPTFLYNNSLPLSHLRCEREGDKFQQAQSTCSICFNVLLLFWLCCCQDLNCLNRKLGKKAPPICTAWMTRGKTQEYLLQSSSEMNPFGLIVRMLSTSACEVLLCEMHSEMMLLGWTWHTESNGKIFRRLRRLFIMATCCLLYSFYKPWGQHLVG